MKKITMLIGSLLIGSLIYAQQPPQGAAGGGAFWRKGGNTGPFGSPNIFGTATGNNNPIYTYTNGIAASKLNGNLGYNVNLYPGTRNGFMLLGIQTLYSQNKFNVANFGAFSLLHLNGNEGTFVQEGGYRPWMRTGVTFTDNNDLSYMGIRKVGNGTDITETAIVWSDNGNNGFPGPDDMVFRFTSGGAGNTAISNDLNTPFDLDGYHVARFAGSGEFGLGNTFGADNPLYVRPASLQHLSLSNMRSVYTQYTNRNIAPGSGTSEGSADGFRIGILGNNNGQQNGNALVYQQENRHLLFSTNANTNAINPLNTQERMRVSHVGAPTELPNNGYGNNNPAGLNANITRVSISHNPGNPVTRPLSLLHLGYNTGNAFAPAATDGWRPWMDVGTFTSNGTDNIYVGLKQEPGAFPANDRQDAIIGWGDNDGLFPLTQPDFLRFIFTATQSIPSNSPGSSLNGLEIARMDPRLASTLPAPNYGMMGIGDWTTAFNVANPINAKLDIDGDLRIRTVTQDNALTQVLVIDPSDRNRVHWKDITPIIGGGFGSLCGSITPTALTVDNEVQLANNSFHFSGTIAPSPQTGNNVGINTNCATPLAAKLHVNQFSSDFGTTGTYILNTDATSFTPTSNSSIGLYVENAGVTQDLASCHTVAAWFETDVNVDGSQNLAICVPQSGGQVSFGFNVANAAPLNSQPDVCGIMTNSTAILEVNGDIYSTGFVTISDINVKTNIAPITSALDKVKKLNGVYFDYNNTNYPNLSLSANRQVGLIAQNVDTVLTEVTNYDSTLQAYTLDYSKITALLIEAIKEQDNNIDSLANELSNQDSINIALENRLLALEQCLSQTNLCNQQAKTSYDNSNEGQVIELSNANAIILDQNLPNPFAEKTSIAYSIPDDVFEAQLLFYDMSGRIIKQVDITERGDGKLTVYGENLKNGIYTYSLIADGKLIATKKMVKQ